MKNLNNMWQQNWLSKKDQVFDDFQKRIIVAEQNVCAVFIFNINLKMT